MIAGGLILAYSPLMPRRSGNSHPPEASDRLLASNSDGFEPACLAAFDDLRGALIELYTSVGADPVTPQDVARRFRVNKTLTWTLSKVMNSNDPIATLPIVPGESSMKTLLAALQRHGAKPEAIERVRKAIATLDGIVEHHLGDRATLQMVVDGMGRGKDDRLESSRKLAFRGNSGLWGVQARTRLMTVFMAPNKDDPARLDMALVRGYIEFRRLRSDVRWPIFQLRGWGEANAPAAGPWQPLETAESDLVGLPLLTRFSTVAPHDIEEVKGNDGVDYMLAPGPIGNAGAVDFYIADCAQSVAGIYRTATDTTGEFGATISVPTEKLVFDLIVDESLDFALHPEVRAFGGVFSEPSESQSPSGSLPIPMPQNIVSLPGQPPVVAITSVPDYPKIVELVNQRMGWDGKAFRGVRMELPYPPLGSTVLLRFKLPEPPSTHRV